jgi:hypothetical protein
VDALGTAPIIANASGGMSHWINGLIQCGNKLYDSNGNVERVLGNIPNNVYSCTNLQGNSTDGYFITQKPLSTPAEVYAYDWESNTSRLMYAVQFQVGPNMRCVMDTERAEGLVGNNNGVDTVIKRTADGVNWTPVPGIAGAYGQWHVNHFQHVNINMAFRAYWDGNIDAVGTSLNNNSLFPGFLGNGWYYAGRNLLVNGSYVNSASATRLWDIIPK